jgi:arsenite methyltransferase
MMMKDNETVREEVRSRYGAIAAGYGSCCCGGDCQTAPRDAGDHAAKLGYAPGEVEAVPDGADMGLGCGNPQAIAALRAGEIVLDLGSGGGLDCFLAAKRVAPDGKVIGVDMTPEMVSKARRLAKESGYDNVEFRLGEIEHLPVADSSIDVILSNCVINLSPHKPAVYAEAFRVLRPGGRLAVSDVVAVKPLPPEVRDDPAAYCGCVGGASLLSDVEAMLTAAGFTDVHVLVRSDGADIVSEWQPGSGHEEYVLPALISAVKRYHEETK